MATIAEQLTSLNDTKTAIRDAISAKGVSVSDTDTFASYADKIAEIPSGTEVNKTKFGCTIDNFLGSVDSEGNYVAPTEKPTITFTGVTRAATSGGCVALLENIDGSVVFPDLTYVEERSFAVAFSLITGKLSITFPVLEEISADQVFVDALAPVSGYSAPRVYFPVLKKISGSNVFDLLLNGAGTKQFFDSAFPVLEEISGNQVFYWTFGTIYEKIIASRIKTIIGGDSASNATFPAQYTSSSTTIKLYLPAATSVSGYIIKPYTGRSGEIHFAVANQAAIEACEGYDYMFGATEIYFDLITTITIDGVAYSRGLTIDGYTAWEDTSGNTVYTDATAEPAVDTVVYSDAGTTQVGVVSAVE